jgi:Flp pilus assembly protein TadG
MRGQPARRQPARRQPARGRPARGPGSWRRRLRRDDGSLSVWVVLFAFITMILLTLLVDGGQVIIAKSQAADMAEQAARAAADDIAPAALRGGQVALAAGACDQNGPAASLLASYSKGVGTDVTQFQCQPGTDPAGAPEATVTVWVTVSPAISAGAFGHVSFHVSETAYLACGTADARVAC